MMVGRMGSIYGIISKQDYDTVDRAKAMARSLEHRVHDRSWFWNDDRCAIGTAILHVALGSELERSPDLGDLSSTHIIACDARIDNREYLVEKFGLPSTIRCDSELILALYQSVGDDCVNHLLGAFAFAIYDLSDGSLFCARDHFGEKPFSYAFADNLFAFASEPMGVVASGVVKPEVNDTRILSLLTMNPRETTSTVYRGVLRLQGSHALRLDRTGLRVWRYWKPQIPEVPLSGSDDEIVARFITLLREAVHCRLRSSKPVGALLSGGLDSSTIVMLAREKVAEYSPERHLSTFSATFPTVPGSDEEKWIELVEGADARELAPIVPFRHQMDNLSPLAHTASLAEALDEPMLAPNLFQIWELASQAKAKGMGVLLGGHDGDAVVSHGFSLLTELVLNEEWDRFAIELDSLSEFLGNYDSSKKALLAQYAVPCVLYLKNIGAPLRAFRTARILRTNFGVSARSLLGATAPGSLKWIVRKWSQPNGRSGLTQLTRTVRASNRFQSTLPLPLESWRTSAAEDHLRNIELPLIGESFEFFDRIGARIGIEQRHPFFDKRLVEFCLALPVHFKVRDGWTRFILREATRGILPEPVRLRRDKSNLGHALAVSLTDERDRLAAAFSTAPPAFSRFWDVESLQQTVGNYMRNPNSMDAFILQFAYSHAVWMEGQAYLDKSVGEAIS